MGHPALSIQTEKFNMPVPHSGAHGRVCGCATNVKKHTIAPIKWKPAILFFNCNRESICRLILILKKKR